MTVVHWDDEPGADLARAVGAEWACLRRVTVAPGGPLHLDADDRVSLVWALDRDAALVRAPGDVERSVRAEGTLDLLLFAAAAPRPNPRGASCGTGVVRPSELRGERVLDGRASFTRFAVSDALGARGVDAELVEVTPGHRSYPVLDLDEVSVVLGGTGRVVVGEEEPHVARGNVVGHGERFLAGPQGLRVLCFREHPQPA